MTNLHDQAQFDQEEHAIVLAVLHAMSLHYPLHAQFIDELDQMGKTELEPESLEPSSDTE